MDYFKQKIQINRRVQARYDELMREGKHGHYETMFRVVHEERAAASQEMLHEAQRAAFSIAVLATEKKA